MNYLLTVDRPEFPSDMALLWCPCHVGGSAVRAMVPLSRKKEKEKEKAGHSSF